VNAIGFSLTTIGTSIGAAFFMLTFGRPNEDVSMQTNRVQVAANTPTPEAATPIRVQLAPALRDPFVSTEVTPPQVPQTQPIAAAPVAPAQESAPALNLRFEGRMVSPAGVPMIFASLDGTTTVLSVGQGLPNGYVVKSIGANAVEFDYPPLGTSARLDIPPEPRVGIR